MFVFDSLARKHPRTVQKISSFLRGEAVRKRGIARAKTMDAEGVDVTVRPASAVEEVQEDSALAWHSVTLAIAPRYGTSRPGPNLHTNSRSLTCRPPQVPMQPNFYDCGLYVLHFVETFMSNTSHYVSAILVRACAMRIVGYGLRLH